MRSQYILSFLPSLFSLLPPFFFHKLRQIHMGCKLWGVSPAGPPVSSWLSLSADEVTYFITPPCRYLKVEHDNAWIMGFLNSLPFEVLLFIYLGRGGRSPCERIVPSSGFPPHIFPFTSFSLTLSPRLTLSFASIIKYPTLRNLNNVTQMEKTSHSFSQSLAASTVLNARRRKNLHAAPSLLLSI